MKKQSTYYVFQFEDKNNISFGILKDAPLLQGLEREVLEEEIITEIEKTHNRVISLTRADEINFQ